MRTDAVDVAEDILRKRFLLAFYCDHQRFSKKFATVTGAIQYAAYMEEHGAPGHFSAAYVSSQSGEIVLPLEMLQAEVRACWEADRRNEEYRFAESG